MLMTTVRALVIYYTGLLGRFSEEEVVFRYSVIIDVITVIQDSIK